MGREQYQPKDIYQQKNAAEQGLTRFNHIIETEGSTLFGRHLQKARENGSYPMALADTADRREEVAETIKSRSKIKLKRHIERLSRQIARQNPIGIRLDQDRRKGLITEDEHQEAKGLLQRASLRPEIDPKQDGTVASPDTLPPPEKKSKHGLTKREKEFIAFLRENMLNESSVTTERAVAKLYPDAIGRIDYNILRTRFRVFLSFLRKKPDAPDIITAPGKNRGEESMYHIKDGVITTAAHKTISPAPPRESSARRPGPAKIPKARAKSSKLKLQEKPQEKPHVMPVKRFMEEILSPREREVYQVLLKNPSITKFELTKEVFGKKEANTSRLATINTALYSLGQKMRDCRGEEIEVDDPSRKLGSQTVRLKSDAVIPPTQDVQPNNNSAAPKPLPIRVDKRPGHRLSPERFDQIQRQLEIDLSGIILSRITSLGTLEKNDAPFEKKPLEVLNATSLSPDQIRVFLSELEANLKPDALVAGFAMRGIEDFWGRTGNEMLGRPNRELVIFNNAQVLKQRRVRISDIAHLVYNHFGLTVPQRYKDNTGRR